MKNLVCLVVGLAAAVPAFAGRYGGPVLVKATGKLANAGVANTCEVYAGHPELRGSNLSLLIDTARKAATNKALHVVATIPSIEYYAYSIELAHPGTSAVRAVKVSLLQDYSDTQTREGQEAQELIKLIDKVCK